MSEKRVARSTAKILAGKSSRISRFSFKSSKYGPEVKRFTSFNTGNALIGGTGAVFNLSSISQGTDDNLRIGRKIMIKGVTLWVDAYSASTNSIANLRCIMFSDKSSDGTQPTDVQVLVNTTFAESPFLADNRHRFRILYDKFCSINNSNQSFLCDKVYVRDPCKGDYTTFLTTANTSACAGMNHLYIMFLSDVNITAAAGAGNARSGISYACEVTYTDS